MKQLLCVCLALTITTQAARPGEDEDNHRPVRAPFESSILIDNQTTVVPVKGTLEYNIQHKFSPMDNGFSDLFGIYSPGANMRMHFSYVPVKNLQLGYGLSLHKMFSDFSARYTILEQTRSNSMPVAVGIYGNMAIDGRNNEAFGDDYDFLNRMAYFSQIIVGRKFTDRISVQANSSFTHYNATPAGYDRDRISVGINGRINLTFQSSILLQYDRPLFIEAITEYREEDRQELSKPNLGIGWENRKSLLKRFTFTHCGYGYGIMLMLF